jgi:hypothetical protein
MGSRDTTSQDDAQRWQHPRTLHVRFLREVIRVDQAYHAECHATKHFEDEADLLDVVALALFQGVELGDGHHDDG